MEVEFVARMREERKFASLDALKAQMARDLAARARGPRRPPIWRFRPNPLIPCRREAWSFAIPACLTRSP